MLKKARRAFEKTWLQGFKPGEKDILIGTWSFECAAVSGNIGGSLCKMNALYVLESRDPETTGGCGRSFGGCGAFLVQ